MVTQYALDIRHVAILLYDDSILALHVLVSVRGPYTLRIHKQWQHLRRMIMQLDFYLYLPKLQVQKSDHECLNPKVKFEFHVDSRSESPVHSWCAKVLALAYINISFCHFNLYDDDVSNMATFTVIYSLGNGLCTLTALPRSTQPSTLSGTVKWVSA